MGNTRKTLFRRCKSFINVCIIIATAYALKRVSEFYDFSISKIIISIFKGFITKVAINMLWNIWTKR